MLIRFTQVYPQHTNPAGHFNSNRYMEHASALTKRFTKSGSVAGISTVATKNTLIGINTFHDSLSNHVA